MSDLVGNIEETFCRIVLFNIIHIPFVCRWLDSLTVLDAFDALCFYFCRLSASFKATHIDRFDKKGNRLI